MQGPILQINMETSEKNDADRSMLYPSIGHMRDALQAFAHVPHAFGEEVDYVGTVKLHGTHGDVIQDRETGEITVQSRNRVLSRDNDNCGFAKFVHTRSPETWSGIFNFVASFFPEAKRIGLYGEFCGKKIQSGVGISQIDQFYVIVDVRVDWSWEHSSRMLKAIAERRRLYDAYKKSSVHSILEFPEFVVRVNLLNPGPAQTEIDQLTEEIGAECPVARKLIQSVHLKMKRPTLVFESSFLLSFLRLSFQARFFMPFRKVHKDNARFNSCSQSWWTPTRGR
jgi:hypothetical protein